MQQTANFGGKCPHLSDTSSLGPTMSLRALADTDEMRGHHHDNIRAPPPQTCQSSLCNCFSVMMMTALTFMCKLDVVLSLTGQIFYKQSENELLNSLSWIFKVESNYASEKCASAVTLFLTVYSGAAVSHPPCLFDMVLTCWYGKSKYTLWTSKIFKFRPVRRCFY